MTRHEIGDDEMKSEIGDDEMKSEIGDDEMKSGIGDDEIGPDLMKFERSERSGRFRILELL